MQFGKTELQKFIPANIARRNMKAAHFRMLNSARQNADLPQGENLALTTSNGFASAADSRLSSIGTKKQNTARVHVVNVKKTGQREQTYDLTVACQHEFFANGILVHNSVDALRYAIFSDYSRGLDHKPESKKIIADHRRHGLQFSRTKR